MNTNKNYKNNSGISPTLHSKRHLIEGFIEKSLQGLVQGEKFDEYIEKQKQKEISQIA